LCPSAQLSLELDWTIDDLEFETGYVSPPNHAKRRLFFRSMRKLPLLGCDAVIRVYDAAGNVIETHEHAGEFKEG